jgi:hypothetical protein
MALGTAQPVAGQPIDERFEDFGVDGVSFGWSYLPCGGLQYQPGDANYQGPNFDDYVFLKEGKQCQYNRGGTLSQTPYTSRNIAITACYNMNKANPDTCQGIYDPQCDGLGQFFLCAVDVPLVISAGGQHPSCVYTMIDTHPDPSLDPFGGVINGRRLEEVNATELAPPAGESQYRPYMPMAQEWEFPQLWEEFRYDLQHWWVEEYGYADYEEMISSLDSELLLEEL